MVVLSPTTPPSNLRLLTQLRTEFEALRILPRDVPGLASALNAGFRESSAPRIGLLLSDDWLDRQAVEKCLPYNSDIVSSGNRVYGADGVSIFQELGRSIRRSEFLRRDTMEGKARYLQHFFLFRKSKLLEIGGADESLGDFPGIDDFDMIWVLLEHGATVTVVEEQLYNYRDHYGCRLSLRPADEAVATLEKILDKHGVTGSEREKLLCEHGKWYGRPLHQIAEELKSKRA